MREILLVLYIITQIFWYMLLARIVVEMIASFSRGWSPRGVLAVVLEWLFTVTDLPVKALKLDKSFPGLLRVAADSAGGAWTATAKDLARVSAAGQILSPVQPFGGAGTIAELVARQFSLATVHVDLA